MEVIQPKFEVKLDSCLEEVDLSYQELDEGKLFLSQFRDEVETVYLTLNNLQVSINVNDLKTIIDMFHCEQFK